MDKFVDLNGYIISHDVLGVRWDRVYLDVISAQIALLEHYSKDDIANKRARIITISITTYVDLKTDIKTKESCPVCGGIGKVKDSEREGKSVTCPQCKGDKEIWIEKRAITIY